MQFIQESMDGITIRLVVDPARYTDQDKKLILDEMRYRFGDDMDFLIEIVDKIDKEKSGKYSLIKNRL